MTEVSQEYGTWAVYLECIFKDCRDSCSSGEKNLWSNSYRTPFIADTKWQKPLYIGHHIVDPIE